MTLMHITPTQMLMFEAGAHEVFLRSLVRDMHRRAPPSLTGFNEAGLVRLVRAGVARGRAWGLTWQSTLAGFVYAMCDVSPNWDGQPELHMALLHRRASADASFSTVFDAGTDEAWEGAAAMRSGVGWFLPAALPWAQRRERLAAALPVALEPVRPVGPGTALELADAGQQLAFQARRDGEDAAFLLAVGLAVAGQVRLDRLLRVMAGGPAVDDPAWLNVLRSWVRHNTQLWV